MSPLVALRRRALAEVVVKNITEREKTMSLQQIAEMLLALAIVAGAIWAWNGGVQQLDRYLSRCYPCEQGIDRWPRDVAQFTTGSGAWRRMHPTRP